MALGPTSFFREAADLWFAKIQDRRADSTADTYANCLKKQVLPKLGELRLADGRWVARCRYARPVGSSAGTRRRTRLHAANTRRMIRAIVRQVAVRADMPDLIRFALGSSLRVGEICAVRCGVTHQAVLNQVMPSNPVRELERIETPRGHMASPPRGLTVEERRRLSWSSPTPTR
ncbi:hypothetical protein [Pseudonocardia pini]|uniref:hypothetical protein n=1 Tax=Pseudonocardia pini TaxID=2758030 RepID=UPI0015F04C44|nr:hypothetical protein [Pseudonocardia pini]